MKPHIFWTALVASLLLAACTQTSGPTETPNLSATATTYTVTELAGLSDSTDLYIRELSADGSVIVGSAYGGSAYRAVKWNAAGNITALGTLGGRDSGASAVSADGRTLVGRSWNTFSADNGVKWDAAGAVTDLATLGGEYYRDEADHVSDDGSVIVGHTYNNLISKQQVVRWNTSGQITVLNAQAGGGPVTWPRDVSADGTLVIGDNELPRTSDFDYRYRALKWNSAGQLTVLSDLGGGSSSTSAVNADGSVIVGRSRTSGGLEHAVRWNSAGQIMALANLGGRYSSADAISADGNVMVGYAQNSSNQSRAVKWNAAGQLTDLGTLPGGASSRAEDVSADGNVILGSSQNSAGNYRAVIWDAAGQITDLPTLGGADSYPTALSADGRVAIGAAENAAGVYRAVVWRAVEGSKQNQTLAFTSSAPSAATVGGSYTVAATASSGLPVSISSATTGVCTVSGSAVRFVAAGTCTVRADQAGNASYNPAPTVTQSFAVRSSTAPATYTADFTTAPVGRVISSIRLGRGVSGTGTAGGTVGLYARRKDKGGNTAMVASSARHLVISNGTTYSYSLGGFIDLKFSTFGTGAVTVNSVKVKSTTTTGGRVKVYRGSTLVKTVSVPKTGVGVVRTLTLGVTNATLVRVTLTGSGAVDDLVVTP